MSTQTMEVVTLEPMRVAYYRYEGEEPEGPAIQKVIEWATKTGLLSKDRSPRFFGFNNPNPSEGNPVYGYEFWMTVPEGAKGDDVVKTKEVAGGLYATTGPQPTIAKVWEAFDSEFGVWLKEKRYEYARDQQWLEEHVPNMENYPEFSSLTGKGRWVGYAGFLPLRKLPQEKAI